jgi:hypothetical protein
MAGIRAADEERGVVEGALSRSSIRVVCRPKRSRASDELVRACGGVSRREALRALADAATASASTTTAEEAAEEAAEREHDLARQSRVRAEKLRALKPVGIAIAANSAIFVAKLAIWTVGGSSAMFAEAVHSLADVCNQYLLRVGILRSMKGPDAVYNYGYSRERFVWSLISAVGIFCLGAGVNIVHGAHGLTHPQPVEAIAESLGVLALSCVVEGYSLKVAYDHLKESARRDAMGIWEFVRLGRCVALPAAVDRDACESERCLCTCQRRVSSPGGGLGSVGAPAP